METHTLHIKKKRETVGNGDLWKESDLAPLHTQIKAAMTLGETFELSEISPLQTVVSKTCLARAVGMIKWTSVYKVPSRAA